MYKGLYDTDKDIKGYVDRYCKTYHKSVDDALKDRIVIAYIDHKQGKRIDLNSMEKGYRR